MKARKEYIVLAVVLIALGIYLVVDQNDQVHYQLPALKTHQPGAITRLVIERAGQNLELEKKEEKWQIMPQGWTVDEDKIKPLLEAMGQLELTALVSTGGNDASYGLDKENRIRVTAWAGDEQIRCMDIGKVAPSYQHTFVRVQGHPGVFHAAGSFRRHAAKSPDQLRKETMEKKEENQSDSSAAGSQSATQKAAP